MFNRQEKSELLMFFVINFGLVTAMGIVMGIGIYLEKSVEIFVATQMLYPILGVIAAIFYNRKDDLRVPRKLFLGIACFTIIMIILSILSITVSGVNWQGIAGGVQIAGAIVLWILYFFEESEKKEAYRFSNYSQTKIVWIKYVLLFLVLYIVGEGIVNLFACMLEKKDYLAEMGWLIQRVPWIIPVLPDILFSFAFFWGEEYGWRVFLQPLLQQKFGLKKGVLLLGIIWGIWHLPISLFYYAPDVWIQRFVRQLILCLAFSVFLAFVYLKTKSVWPVAIIHAINNSMSTIFNQDIGPKNIFAVNMFATAVLLILYIPFLKAKVFCEHSILKTIKL